MRATPRLFQEMTPEATSALPVFDGAVIRKTSFRFVSEPSGTETLANAYEAEFEKDKCRFGLLNSPKPHHPREWLNELGDAVLMNAGFMFTVDRTPIEPENFAYHLQIAGGCPIGLPTKTKHALIAKDGRLRVQRVKAEGWLAFGPIEIDWIGSHEPLAADDGRTVVYGPANQGLIKTETGISTDQERGCVTPRAGRRNVVVRLDSGGSPYIARVTAEPVAVLEGAYVLETPLETARQLEIGSGLIGWSIGGLDRKNTDDAATVGFSLPPDPEKLAAMMVEERIVITRRPNGEPYYSGDHQKARTCVFETADGRVHFLVIDARPRVAGQRGMSVRDLAAYVHDRYEPVWAVAGDGGQSSKLGYNRGETSGLFGNLHYVDLKGEEPTWDGINGRPVTSCVVARPTACD